MSDLYEPNLKLNWIEQLPSKQGVAGSSPAGVAITSAQLIEILSK